MQVFVLFTPLSFEALILTGTITFLDSEINHQILSENLLLP